MAKNNSPELATFTLLNPDFHASKGHEENVQKKGHSNEKKDIFRREL